MALEVDNPGCDDEWGYAIRPTRLTVDWFKLGYAAKGRPREVDDPLLQQSLGKSLMRLPPGMDYIDCISTMYGFLYNHGMRHIRALIRTQELDKMSLRCILTVPATYSNEKKETTRKAAADAGICRGCLDNIEITTEPEAAAKIAIFQTITQDGVCPFKVSSSSFKGPNANLCCRARVGRSLWTLVVEALTSLRSTSHAWIP